MWSWQPPTPTQRKHSSLQPWDTAQTTEQQDQQLQPDQYLFHCHESMPNPSIASDILSSSHKKSTKSQGSYKLFPAAHKHGASAHPQRPAGGSHVEYSRKAGSDEEKRGRTNVGKGPAYFERFTVGSLPAPKNESNPLRYSEFEPASRLRLSHGPYLEAEGRRSIGNGSQHAWSDAHSNKESAEAMEGGQNMQEFDIEQFIANSDRNLLGNFELNPVGFDLRGQDMAADSPPDNSRNPSNEAGGSGENDRNSPSDELSGMKETSSSGVGSSAENYQELEVFTQDLLTKFENVLQSKRTNAKTHELPAEEWGKVAQDLQEAKLSFTPQQLVELSKAGRDESLKAQSFLKTLSPERLDLYAKHFEQQLDVLMSNKFANYVVQHLLSVHPPTLAAVEQVSLAKFATLASNEYASRTMQRASQNNTGYISKALICFMDNFESVISTIPGSIFLCKLVSSTLSKIEHRLVLEPLKQKKEYLGSPYYYTRVLSTIAGICDEEVLAEIVQMVSQHIWDLMNDKFGNYLILVFFDRKQQTGIKLATDACLQNCQDVVSRKLPKFILLRLLKAKHHKNFVQELAEKIVTQPLDSLLKYIGRKENVALFLLIVGRLAPPMIEKYLKPLHQEILKESTDKPHVATELLEYLNRLIELTQKANRSLPCLVGDQPELSSPDG